MAISSGTKPSSCTSIQMLQCFWCIPISNFWCSRAPAGISFQVKMLFGIKTRNLRKMRRLWKGGFICDLVISGLYNTAVTILAIHRTRFFWFHALWREGWCEAPALGDLQTMASCLWITGRTARTSCFLVDWGYWTRKPLYQCIYIYILSGEVFWNTMNLGRSTVYRPHHRPRLVVFYILYIFNQKTYS